MSFVEQTWPVQFIGSWAMPDKMHIAFLRHVRNAEEVLYVHHLHSFGWKLAHPKHLSVQNYILFMVGEFENSDRQGAVPKTRALTKHTRGH
jgi:hypothetical protein